MANNTTTLSHKKPFLKYVFSTRHNTRLPVLRTRKWTKPWNGNRAHLIMRLKAYFALVINGVKETRMLNGAVRTARMRMAVQLGICQLSRTEARRQSVALFSPSWEYVQQTLHFLSLCLSWQWKLPQARMVGWQRRFREWASSRVMWMSHSPSWPFGWYHLRKGLWEEKGVKMCPCYQCLKIG